MNYSASDFLAIGFIPCTEMASEYIYSLLEPVRTSERAPDLLQKIIQELLYDSGFHNIAIPLSGGFDSRSILGAALEIWESGSIRCVTVGSEKLPDYALAAHVCRRLGVAHARIDPNGLEWDLDRLQELARSQFVRLGSLIPADALIMFDAIAERTSSERVVLSGYLGDAISGKHLPSRNRMLSADKTTDAFIERNQIDPSFKVAPNIRQTLLDFVNAHADVIERLPGAALYDLLDLGFRQRHRIRAVTTWAFSSYVTPYEDPRWVSHWLLRPYSDRVDQSAYRSEMIRAFPAVFSRDSAKPSRPVGKYLLKSIASSFLSASNYQILRQAVRSVTQPFVEVLENRGDPRRNASMSAAMRHLLHSFDKRKILRNPTLPRFESLLTSPTVRNAVICRWVASTELHIRAGNLTTDGTSLQSDTSEA